MATTTTNTTYRDVLKRAFQITRKYKFLWFFGFFAAFLSGGSELNSVFRDYINLPTTTRDIFSLQTWYQGGTIAGVIDNFRVYFTNYPWQSIFMLLMIAVIALVLLWLAIISQIALFDTVNKVAKGKAVNYSEGFQVGNVHFVPVLWLNVVIKIALYFLLVVIATPLVSWFLIRSSVLGGVLFVILMFFVFIPISVIVSFVLKYALAYIVLKDQRAWPALQQGWRLFKKNWVVSVEMAVLLLGIGLLVGLGIVLILGFVSIPFIMIIIAALLFGSPTGFAAAIVCGVLAWLAVVIVLGASYVAYQYTAWTLLYLKLVDEQAQSKLVRWFTKLVPSKT